MDQEDINEIISNSTPEWRNRQIRSEGEYMDLQNKYHALLAVTKKYSGETRHDNAVSGAAEPRTLDGLVGL